MSKFSNKLAPRGSYCLGIAIGLSIAGLMIKDGVLITIAFSAITLLFCCYILGRRNIANLEASVMLPSRLHATKRYQPHLSLYNKRSLLDAFNVKLTIALPHGTLLACETPWIAAQTASSSTCPIAIPMRATALDHPYKITSFFPLSFFHFSRHQILQHPVTIYPRSITPMELLEHGSLGQCTVPLQNAAIQDSGEPRGVRSFQPGDSAKHIHWPASARSLAQGHGIRIREYDPPGQLPEHCTLLFHSFSADREMMREDTFERAISLLAGTIKHLRNLKIRVTVITDFLGWNPLKSDTRIQYYELLALLADCQRAIGTQKHELQQVIDQLSKNEPSIFISDMHIDAWKSSLNTKANHLCIDIRQVRFPHKKTVTPKQALAKSA